MQRREAKIGLRDRKRHRRPKERNDAVRSQIRTGLHLQFPANREINREFRDSGPSEANFVHETTVLQRLFTKFPTQINRENILKNREFLSGNREFHLQGAQASISPTLVLRIAIV